MKEIELPEKMKYARLAAHICMRCGVGRTYDDRKTCDHCETIEERTQRMLRKQNNEKAKMDRLKLRDEVYANYGGYKCACCGCTHREMLEIDHILGSGGSHRKFITLCGYSSIYEWLKTHGFPIGFQPLCSNCNHGRHRNGGVCPHKKETIDDLKFKQKAFEVLRDIILKEAGGHETEIFVSLQTKKRLNEANDDDLIELLNLFRKTWTVAASISEIQDLGIQNKIQIWPWTPTMIYGLVKILIDRFMMQPNNDETPYKEMTYSLKEGWDKRLNPPSLLHKMKKIMYDEESVRWVKWHVDAFDEYMQKRRIEEIEKYNREYVYREETETKEVDF